MIRTNSVKLKLLLAFILLLFPYQFFGQITFYYTEFSRISNQVCEGEQPQFYIEAYMTGASGTSISAEIKNTANGETETFTVQSGVRTLVTWSKSVLANNNFNLSVSAEGYSESPLSGAPTLSVSKIANPNIQTLTGTDQCGSGNTLTIGLGNSEFGVVYELLQNGLSMSPVRAVNGTGNSMSNAFSTTQIGTYTVRAQRGTCDPVMMNGTKYLRDLPIQIPFKNNSPVCNTGEIALTTSQVGVTYKLLKDGVDTGLAINGNGGEISFGDREPGLYTVEATSGGGCSVLMSDSRTVNPLPTAYSLSLNKTTYCESAVNSGVSLTLSGSETATSYRLYKTTDLINPVSTSLGTGGALVWNNIEQGTYYVIATASGCSREMANRRTVTKLQPPTATIYASSVDRKCFGAVADFRVTVELTGTAPFNFKVVNNVDASVINVTGYGTTSWTSTSLSFNESRTYSVVEVTDGSGCDVVDGTGVAFFSVDPLPVIQFSPQEPELCYGSSTVITASGAGAGGNYEWSDGLGSGASVTVAPPNNVTYQVTATTANGCKDTKTVDVKVNPLPILDFSPDGNDYSVCVNGGDVVLTPNTTGGSFYTNGILMGSSDFDPAGSGVGRHDVTYIYKDGNGCENSITKEMVVLPAPVVSIPNLRDNYCADDADPTVIRGYPQSAGGVFDFGGYAQGGMWQDNGNGTMNLSPNGVITNIGAGTYDIKYTYTDSEGCTSSIVRITTINDDLGDAVRFRNLPSVTCQTGADITLQAYLLDPPNQFDINSNDGYFSGPGITDNGDGTATFSPSVAGNGLHTIRYDYTDPVSGCTGDYSEQVQIGTTLTIHGVNPIFCVDDGQQQFWGAPQHGSYVDGWLYLYSWDGINDFSKVLVANKKAASSTVPLPFTPSTTGNYLLEYAFTDAGGCVNIVEEEFRVEADLDASLIAYKTNPANATNQFCIDAGLITLAPASGASPGGYYYGTDPGWSIKGGNKFDPIEAGVGTHRVYRKISSNCEDVKYIDIEIYATTAEVVLPKYEYCINDETGPFVVEANNLTLIGSAYSGEATAEFTFMADSPSPLYTVSGGVRTYHTSIKRVDGDAPIYFDPAVIRPNASADFVTTIKMLYDNSAKEGGCVSLIDSNPITIKIVPDMNFGTSDPMLFCENDAPREIKGTYSGGGFTGGGNFSGSGIINGDPDDGIAMFDPSISGSGSFPITYTYTNANGCVSERTKTFVVKDSPIVYDVTPTGADPTDGYYCDGSAGVVIGVASSENSVDYQLIKDANIASPVQVVSGTGGAVSFAPVVAEGVYTVQAVWPMPSGCGILMNGSVTVKKSKIVATLSKTDVTCFGAEDGSITISAQGGKANYQYHISDDGGSTYSSQPSNTFINLKPQSYHIKVSDAVGCELAVPLTATITQPNSALSIVKTTKPSGCGGGTVGDDYEGEASITISGGSPFDASVQPSGYSIVWKDSGGNVLVADNQGKRIRFQPAGNYSVTVTDANGCQVSETVIIDEVAPILISEDVSNHINVNCYNGNNGQFVVNASGGATSAVYQFSLDGVSWVEGDVGTPSVKTFSNKKAGTYSVWVRDANYPRCEYAFATPIIVTQPTEFKLVEVVSSHVDVNCYGSKSGQLEVSASGGVSGGAGYSYSIDNGTTWVVSPLFTNLGAGVYNLIAKDANGCIASGVAIEIKQNDNIAITLYSKTNVTCNGGNNGVIKVASTGGGSSVQYSLNNGSVSTPYQTSTQFNSLSAGTYSVTVRDANLCNSVISNIIISQPAVLTISEVVASHKNVSCFGGNDGKFEVLATGGSGDYEFSINGGAWQNVASSNIIYNSLNSGIYRVRVRDLNDPSCFEESGDITITQPASALEINLVSLDNNFCFGGAYGKIEVSVFGGTAPYQYRWYRMIGAVQDALVSSSDVANNLSAGDYKVVVTDANLCVEENIYTITEPANRPSISVASITHVSTPNGNNGSIQISVNGGTAPYSLAWSGTDMLGNAIAGLPQDVTVQPNLVAGVYKVVATDALGCSDVYTNIVVSQPGQNLNLNITQENPSPCNGATNGKISLSAYGGNAPYNSITLTRSGIALPKVSSGNSFANYENLSAGTYSARVEDATGVDYTTIITLTEPTAMLLTFNKDKDVSCFGDNDGSITFTVNGGTPNGLNEYDVILIPSVGASRTITVEENISRTINDLHSADWTLQISDDKGCDVVELFTIDTPSAINVNGTVDNVTCNGANDGKITVSITGGRGGGVHYEIDWYKNSVLYVADGGYTQTNLKPGTYHVEVREFASPNCPATSGNFVVTEPSQLNMSATAYNIATCRGDNSGKITVYVTGGVAPYVVDYGSGTQTGNGPFTITGLTAGNYNVRVIDNNGTGCEVNQLLLISEPTSLLTVDNLITDIDCETPNSGTVTFDVSGGVQVGGNYSYQAKLTNLTNSSSWVVNATNTVNQPETMNFNSYNLPKGDYKLTIRDMNASPFTSCAEKEFLFTLSHIEITAQVVNTACTGVNTGEIKNIQIIGGSGDYSWIWSSLDGLGIDNSVLNQTGLSKGSYELELTDNQRGCTVIKQFAITNSNQVVITASVKGVSCFGAENGMINNVTATGFADPSAVIYHWQGPGVNITMTESDPGFNPNLYDLSGGTYTLTVTDGAGCSLTKSFTVNEPSIIDFNLTTQLNVCDYARSISAINLTGGTGVYNYVWTGPDGFASSGATISDITKGGTYELTVIDGNSCRVTKDITVFGKMKLTADVTDISCFGGTEGSIVLDVTGGSGNYTYNWTGTGVVANNKNQTNLVAGGYTVLVTDLDQSCGGGNNHTATLTVEVKEPTELKVSAVVTHLICAGDNDGKITISPEGGSGSYQYDWSSANGTGLITTNRNQIGLSGGEYSVKITDAVTGCNIVENFTVNEPTAIDFDLTVVDTQCDNSNSITIVNPRGGSNNPANYSYSWAGPGIATSTGVTLQTNLPGGVYTIRMSDPKPGKTCRIEKSVTLTKPLTITSNVVDETCLQSKDGEINITVENGITPYAYVWTDEAGNPTANSTNRNQSSLTAGKYKVVVTDARSCTIELTSEVKLSNVIEIHGSVADVSCNGGNNGSITITVIGGSGNYSYQWSGGVSATTKNISGLTAGAYQLTVTDVALGCEAHASFVVNQPSAPITLDAVSIDNVDCHSFATGEISIDISGGTQPYSYQWSSTAGGNPVVSSQNQTNLKSADYSVRVVDALGCRADFGPFTVSEPSQSVNITLVEVVHVVVNGASTGIIEVDATGGVGNYTYDWFKVVDPSTLAPIAGSTNRQTNLQAGLYQVVVTDANGCSMLLQQIISQPGGLLNITTTVKNIRPCHDANNGELLIQVSGGTPNVASGSPEYQITVRKGGTLISQVDDVSLKLINLTSGLYSIEVKDANGVVETASATISKPDALVVGVNVDNNVSCYLGSDASVTVTVAGGVPLTSSGYRVMLIGGSVLEDRTTANSTTFTNLPEGTYEIRVWDDANGDGTYSNADALNGDCFYDEIITITQPEAEISLTVVAGSEDICIGEIPQMDLIATNWDVVNYPLTITLNDGTSVIMNSSPFRFDVANIPAIGNYNYKINSIEDATGCSKGFSTSVGNVIIRPLPTGHLTGDNRLCLGESSTLSFNLTGTAPWSVTYFDGIHHTTINNIMSSPHSVVVTPVATVNYSLTQVEDKYCSNSGSGTANIIVDQPTTVEMITKDVPVICNGNAFNLYVRFSPNSTEPWKITWKETTASGSQLKTKLVIASDLMVAPNDNLYQLVVNPLETTTYELVSVEVSNNNNNSCDAIIIDQEVIVTVNQLPKFPTSVDGDREVCHGETVVYSTPAIPFATSYDWVLPADYLLINGGGTSSITVLITENAVSDIIKVRGVNPCGSGDYRQLNITVNKYPGIVSDITGPTELCQGSSSINFSVSPMADATGYRWSVPSGLVFAGQGTTSIQLDLDPNVDTFTGQVTVTPYNDCGDSRTTKSHTFVIHPSPVANADINQQVCGNSTTLNAKDMMPSWTGTWSLVAGKGYAEIADATNPNSALTNISRGDVTLLWTVEHQHATVTCKATDEVVIRNNQLAVSASAIDNQVCDGIATVTATNVPALPSTYGQWSVVHPAGSSAMIDDATLNITTIRNLEPGENRFRWSLFQNGCESFAEVTVMNDQPTKANIDGNGLIDVCDNKVDLKADQPIVGVGRWTIIKGYGQFSNANNHEVTVTALSKGENIFRYTVTTGTCDSYDEVMVRNNMLDVDAGENSPVCDGTFELRASPAPLGTFGSWEIIQGTGNFSDGSAYNSSVFGLAPDDNIFEWRVVKNGCISSDRVTITNNQPTVASVGNTQNRCDFETILTGNTPLQGVGRWSIVKGRGVFEDVTDPTTKVTDLGFGENIFRWTIQKGICSSYADLTVNNLKVDVKAGDNITTCSRVAIMNGSRVPAGATGQWSVVAGTGGGTIPTTEGSKYNANISGLEYGQNAFVWSINKNGCISTDVVYVNNSMPHPVDAGSLQTINGTATTMNATTVQYGIGSWSLISGGGTIDASEINNPKARVTNLRRGENVFRWTVVNGDCSNYDEVIIVNGEVVEANAGDNQEVCDGEAILDGNDPDVALGNWSVVSGSAQFENRNDPKTRVFGLANGNNVLRWTVSYSSSSSSDDVVIVNNRPDNPMAGNNDAICSDEVQLKGNTPGFNLGTGEWSLYSGGGLFSDKNIANPIVTQLAPGVNEFVYTITKGICSLSDTVIIINGLPTIADAGDDLVVTCDGSYRLQPNTPTYGTAYWKAGAEGSARFEGNWVHDLAQGTNELIYVIETDYCQSTDTIIVQNNIPTVSYAGRLQDICDTQVEMTADPVYYGVGTWELISGSGTFADINDHASLVTGLSKGENRFKWIVDNNGCKSISEVIIRNNLIESKAGDKQVFCADNTVLRANNPAPGVGSWSVAGGSGAAHFANLNDPHSAVTNLDRGSNLLVWMVEHKGCIHRDTVEIKNNNPTIAKAGQDIPSCDDMVSLTANKPVIGEGRWSIIQGGGDFVSANYADAKNDPSARLENVKFGDNLLRWTISNENCHSYDDVVVSYNTVIAYAGEGKTICDDEAILEGNSPLPGVGSWSVPGGMGAAEFEDVNDPSTKVIKLGKGSNTLRWTTTYRGCQSFSDVVITNDLPSNSYAGNVQTICEDETILDATKPLIGEGYWKVVTGSALFDDATQYNTKVTNLAQGDNILIWITENNLCSLEDQVLIVNNKPSEPYAGADYAEVCSHDFELKAATPDYGTGLWTIIQGGGTIVDSNSPRTHVKNLDFGTNRLRWTVSKGDCHLYADVEVENNTPSKAIAGPNVEDCKDLKVLDANRPTQGMGVWSKVSGYGDFDDDNNAKTTVRNLGFGENVFQWTISKGNCSSSDIVKIFNKIPDKAYAGTPQLDLCDTYTVLNANDPTSGNGIWSVVKGKGTFDDPTKYNSIVRNIGFGENIYRWEVSYGECSTKDEIVIVSNKTEAYAGEEQVVYEPEATLNANNPGELSGVWSIVGESKAQLADNADFNTIVSSLNEGINTFQWTIDVNGCLTSDLVSIDYRPVPDANFITNIDNGCYPLKVVFTNYSVRGSVYMWDFGDGTISDDRNPKHTYTEPGKYTVTLVAPGPDGNDGLHTKEIVVHDHPVTNFTVNPEVVYVPGDKARFYDLSSDAVSWCWDFGDGNTSDERNPSHKYQEEGIYTVQLITTNKYECLDTLKVKNLMTAKPQGYVKLPNAFKPRPSGGADATDPSSEYVVVFKPAHSDVDEFTMEIFNRWGQKIFQTNDIDTGWDGLYEGQLAPQGVYVYKIYGKYINGREFRDAGSVMLVR